MCVDVHKTPLPHANYANSTLESDAFRLAFGIASDETSDETSDVWLHLQQKRAISRTSIPCKCALYNFIIFFFKSNFISGVKGLDSY